jgi:hypothetical protein
MDRVSQGVKRATPSRRFAARTIPPHGSDEAVSHPAFYQRQAR